MTQKYILSLDQGTTSSRAILFNKAGEIVSIAKKEFTQYFPNPGWVEHDAAEIWNGIIEVTEEAMKKIGASAENIAAIGITNQRETTVIWDKNTGEPVCRAIVWQCRRTSETADKLISDGYSDMIRKKTGLVPDAYFSGTKIKWILDNVPGAREGAEAGELLFGTVDSWLIWKLTGGKVHITDVTNASRTMLYNIHTLKWDKELLTLLDIPECILPEVKMSSEVYGYTDASLFGGEIPISGAAGDQQCALFGQCCFHEGDMKNTYGTGCFLLMNTGDTPVDSKNGLVTTIAASRDKVRYALEGSVFVGGAAVQWLRDELKVIASAGDTEAIANSISGTDGAYVVPAFTGVGAPYWNQDARGIIVGITRGFSKAELVRATLESIAYQTNDVIRAMENDIGHPIKKLLVDGGASENGFLMQFQSDITNCDVVRPVCVETTALGAAYLAGLAVGYWRDTTEITENHTVDKVFSPMFDEGKRKELTDGWNRAMKCALSW